jgi:hypothetical protein
VLQEPVEDRGIDRLSRQRRACVSLNAAAPPAVSIANTTPNTMNLDIGDPLKIAPACNVRRPNQWGAVTEVTRSWIWNEYERKLHWECQLLGALP